MNIRCWYELDIDISNAVRDDFQWPDISNVTKVGIWSRKAEKIFDPIWLAYMNELGFKIKTSMLFYRMPFFCSKMAHVDTYGSDPTIASPCGLNWVKGGQGSEMLWYKMPPPPYKVKYTPANTPFFEWPVIDLELIDRCPIRDKLIMTRVDIPHSIAVSAEPRWSISARTDYQLGSWEESLEFFSKVIKSE
jgi:hypothetical protein